MSLKRKHLFSSHMDEQARARHFVFKKVKFSKSSPILSFDFGPGVNALVTEKTHLAQQFIECAIGLDFPHRGTITLDKTSPARSPSLRANLGSLLPVESSLEHTSTVREHITLVERLRKKASVESGPCDFPWLMPLLDKSTTALSPRDCRQVALALALALHAPRALILENPLEPLENSERLLVLQRLHERALSGCIIVCIFPTLRDAHRISHHAQILESSSPPCEQDRRVRFLVSCPDAAQLKLALCQVPALTISAYRESSSLEFIVEGPSEPVTANAIADAALSSQSALFEMARLSQPIGSQGETHS